ncbi:MAG: ATP-binding cassette domain-containing protein [Deltaproteobacteria bacterium]|nr:ATP-binding cassette domain-containing protein [Deltaproteobacteria bacterium]
MSTTMVTPIEKEEGLGQETGIVSAKTANQAVLYVEKLNKSFGGQQVLNDLFLTLRKGEIVCLRGENGSGKTTLLNILSGNLEPDSGRMVIRLNGRQEDFRFPRPWWKNMNPFSHFTPERVAQEGVGRTWQEIRLFPNQTLLGNIAVASPEQKGENPIWALLRPLKVRNQEKEITLRTRSTLKALGLSGREDSSADMVALGQSKRAAIARAIQAGAKVLLLDEPLAGLDEEGINGVMGLLEDLCKDKQITLIIVEHIFNIPRILNLATTVWTLQGGKLSVQGPSDVREEIKHNTSHDSAAWLRELAGQGWHFNERELPGGAILTTVTPAGTTRGDVLMDIQDLIVHRGKRLVIGRQDSEGNLHGFSYSIRRGELALLEAPNGWGKTTLLEAISGLLPITRGTIRFNGQPIQSLPAWDRSNLGISLLRSRSQLFPDLTVHDALRLAKSKGHNGTISEHLLKMRISDLSGGEKQRLAVACALSSRDYCVGLLDEPFSAMDLHSLQYLWAGLLEGISNKRLYLIALPRRTDIVLRSNRVGTNR